ncbi:hypothetical protein KM043_006514 [Ampulex compressa]|nr:hypothetical protein KM043_006514 [Ampulex compressa]
MRLAGCGPRGPYKLTHRQGEILLLAPRQAARELRDEPPRRGIRADHVARSERRTRVELPGDTHRGRGLLYLVLHSGTSPRANTREKHRETLHERESVYSRGDRGRAVGNVPRASLLRKPQPSRPRALPSSPYRDLFESTRDEVECRDRRSGASPRGGRSRRESLEEERAAEPVSGRQRAKGRERLAGRSESRSPPGRPQSSKIPPAGDRELKEAQVDAVQAGSTVGVDRSYQAPQQGGWVQWCSGCRRASGVGVASSTGALAPSAPGPGAAVVGCLVGVYPCSPSSTGPRGPLTHHLQALPSQQQPIGSCRACCCVHSNHQPASVQLTSQRGGLSLRVARVASTTSVRAAPYAHPQHQGLGQECRCREETGALGGGGAHILGSPMLFVPFTVPTFPATHHQTTHPAHQTHHQQLQATNQNPVQQPQQLTQLNQLSHLNHQGIVPATTNQPTIHSTSCSPQQQATTPNKVKTITRWLPRALIFRPKIVRYLVCFAWAL